MNILVSHSAKDNDLFKLMSSALEKDGHTVINASSFNFVNYWKEKETAPGQNIDLLIAIVTDNYLSSSKAQAELSSVILSVREIRTLLIVIGNVIIPDYYSQFVTHKIQDKEKFIESTSDISKIIFATPIEINATDKANSKQINRSERINILKNALNSNQMILVCGAGVSIDSSLPSWEQLMISILGEAITRFPDKIHNKEEDVKTLLSKMPQSNLIIGKYLRLILKDEFDKVLQHSLYSYYNKKMGSENPNNFDETNMLKAISALARPNRLGRHLDSIISFNFDDLIERTLSKHNIKHSSIWKEGQVPEVDALPIYHVHGFLPNKEIIDMPNLVFSEDAYHSQFIDPYSWQNLIQLNAFSKNTCLFIGLSLSDPNLRRLLDISSRRNGRRQHYIVVKRFTSNTDDLITLLFDMDASSLGLNVIWCDDYDEIPDILNQISR